MRYLFAQQHSEVLAQMAWSNVLLAFDFDGTLAPIEADRNSAHMRRRTLSLLTKVCECYPTAVISGRALEDVASRLKGAHVKYLVGNHGLEPGPNLEHFDLEIGQAHSQLSDALKNVPGIDIENKRYSLSIHYRNAKQKKRASEAIYQAISVLSMRLRIVPGKFVINVVPESAPHKGDALLSIRSMEKADTALYVGDDVTDEDVFKIDQPGRLITLRIGDSKSSAAMYFLRSQNEIDKLLSGLAALRMLRGL